MKTLVIGYGEIGKSLANVLAKQYKVFLEDKEKGHECQEKEFDIIHICYPYHEGFKESVEMYQMYFNPKYTVVHSTVPVGTCSSIGAIHSPVVGIHPHLEKSLTTFTKFLGGEGASQVADYFRRAGMKVYITDNSDTTELMKVACTTYYGLAIEFTKDLKQNCDILGIPFEMWTLWNNNYNEGYTKLDMKEYVRPNLVPIMKKIGGHCVTPNLDFYKSDFSDFIKERQKK